MGNILSIRPDRHKLAVAFGTGSLTASVKRCETLIGCFTPYVLPESGDWHRRKLGGNYHLSGGLTSGFSNPLVEAAIAA
jgi:hypothetical protein